MRSLLVLTLSLVPVLGYAASIGRVVEARGSAASDQGGVVTPLKPGSLIELQQSLDIPARSFAVLRMDDDEVVSLGENSRFEVLDYQFDTRVSAGNAARYRLEAGSARLMSGVIARQQPGSVVLETPYGKVTTVGTDYSVRVCAAGAGCGAPGVYVTIKDGKVKVSGDKGSQDGVAGQIVFLPAATSIPVLIAALPEGTEFPPDPEPFLLAAGGSVGPVRIEITGSVCDPAASPSTPECSSNR